MIDESFHPFKGGKCFHQKMISFGYYRHVKGLVDESKVLLFMNKTIDNLINK